MNIITEWEVEESDMVYLRYIEKWQQTIHFYLLSTLYLYIFHNNNALMLITFKLIFEYFNCFLVLFKIKRKK